MSVVFVYINNQLAEWEIQKTNPIYNCVKN